MKLFALRVGVPGVAQWGFVRGALVAQEHRSLYARIRYVARVALCVLPWRTRNALRLGVSNVARLRCARYVRLARGNQYRREVGDQRTFRVAGLVFWRELHPLDGIFRLNASGSALVRFCRDFDSRLLVACRETQRLLRKAAFVRLGNVSHQQLFTMRLVMARTYRWSS